MTRGFTLLETLLFIGASSIIVLIIAGLLNLILVAQTKQTIISEIEETGTRALTIISTTVQDASSVASPTIGQSSTSLTLIRRAGVDTPTVLEIASSTLQLREGVQPASALHSSRIAPSQLAVVNFSPTTSTPGIVDIRFTLSSINPSSRPEYEYSRTFQSSFSLR